MVAQDRDEAAETDALIEAWIEPNPYRSGAADVRLKEYGVSVWAIVGYLQGVGGDAERVARAYDVPVAAVRAAQAYYARHSAVIDARMAANRL